MAKWTMRGMDEYAAYLQRIGKNTREILGAGVYAMANTVADAVRKNIEALPAKPDIEGIEAYRQGQKAQLTISEKKGLQEGFGISPMQNERGYLNVKLGFDGYNKVKTRKYPKGQPNVLIARSVESGSSVREKSPFIRPALRQTQNEALKKGQEAIEEKIKQAEK